MFKKYNALDWYWTVGGFTSQVWSSARVQYVPDSDATYVSWVSRGNQPTSIPTGAGLYNDVLQSQWLPLVMAAGCPCTSASNPSLNDTYSLTTTAMSYITGISAGIAAGKGLPGGGSSFIYAGHMWTADEFLNFASAVENYLYNYTVVLATLVNTGSGSLPSLPIVID